ncbi:hypothetical protein BXZ70DRAFT_670431 [Cristinia sonorae]|uniref:Uncharacterized protein n=1 Tax=Cristinia sonorae TaxID=1940300 RepID=A0A8K0XT37_9AGAR|nr:hypothetical protein BXZ70DRAFT_670431 [Cristinia sonorae]
MRVGGIEWLARHTRVGKGIFPAPRQLYIFLTLLWFVASYKRRTVFTLSTTLLSTRSASILTLFCPLLSYPLIRIQRYKVDRESDDHSPFYAPIFLTQLNIPNTPRTAFPSHHHPVFLVQNSSCSS